MKRMNKKETRTKKEGSSLAEVVRNPMKRVVPEKSQSAKSSRKTEYIWPPVIKATLAGVVAVADFALATLDIL